MTLARFFHAVLLGSTLLAVTPMRFGFTADAPPAQPAALAVNDISILFPMPKDAAGLPAQPIDGTAAQLPKFLPMAWTAMLNG